MNGQPNRKESFRIMPKPYDISKEVVWDAFKRVKQNQGAAGVDEVSIQDFEAHLEDNLYKLWNRMSSGSYFPPPVRVVEIPKKDGGKRPLGIPTVSDRIAQMVVKIYLEPKVEPHFHPDSYGYRPKKSAIEALEVAKERCWTYPWALDFDIKGFFDNLDHELLMRAVEKHTDLKWVILYTRRWLCAPSELVYGTHENRIKGTPQGGVISPLLSNLFLHYAFDLWMKRNYPSVKFERYADDIVVHCKTEEEAKSLKAAIEKRLLDCKLELHPQKTQIVYCKGAGRPGNYPNQKFDFLGYTFRPRMARTKWGTRFVGFIPAVSNQSATAMRRMMRKWHIHLKSDKSLEDLSRAYNPTLRGWVNYYSRHYKSGLHPVFQHFNNTLTRWVVRKYKKRFKRNHKKAKHWLGNIANQHPGLFAHWMIRIRPTACKTIRAV